MQQREVVITGLGCISPLGNSKAAYYDGLRQGRSGIRRISYFAPAELSCQIAAEVTDFDELLWLSKRDAPHVPRVVPYAIAAAHGALSDAGLDCAALSLEERRRFGVVIGSGGGGIEWTERHYKMFFKEEAYRPSVYAVPSGTIGTLSSEVSMQFDLKGLSHVISTGCTSSTDALGYAFQNIQSGRADRLLCGGVDAPITPGTMTGFCLMRVVTPSWNENPEQGSRPFSRNRDGFVLGEGAWVFLLEEKSLAQARGARILAEIKGYGVTCDAYHRVRLDESGEEPARAMQLALEEAGIGPEAIDYINLHGTSTQLNDPIETRAVKNAFGKSAYQLAASSTKSMIGHPQGASGAAGLAAILFAFETGILPPTINLDTPDPECDLDYVPEAGRKKSVEWAMGNCIGFGSKNSAVVLHQVN